MKHDLSADPDWEKETRAFKVKSHFDKLDRQQGIQTGPEEEPDICLICEQDDHETDACPQAEWNQREP